MEYPIKIETKMKFTYIMTPYAAIPSSPARFISWKLYRILTMDMEMLVISSEEPFVQAFIKILPCHFALVRWSRLLFLEKK